MKNVKFIVLVFLFCASVASATPVDINIYENVTISSGDVYRAVHIYDSQTTPPEQTTVNMMGGEVDSFFCEDTSKLVFESGTATYVGGYNQSIIELKGGTVGYSSLLGSSVMHWSGGIIDSYISIHENAKLYVYGHNLVFTQGGPYGYGTLSGYLLEDNTYFDIFFRSLPQPFEDLLGTNIFLVPEPTTILLFAFGGLLLRRTSK